MTPIRLVFAITPLLIAFTCGSEDVDNSMMPDKLLLTLETKEEKMERLTPWR